jgi:predicted SAM-dependent methyltransferase
MKKINIGCGWRNFGKDWIHIDGGDYDHLDYNNITKLEFKDNSVDLIYASHVLEYFDRDEAALVLQEWQRVLKKDGILRIAVPDFKTMSNLYNDHKVQLKDIIGPLYGKMSMGNETIYHKTTYDFQTLKDILTDLGYKDIRLYNWKNYTVHQENDDHSQAYLCPKGDKENGKLISLNIECNKL